MKGIVFKTNIDLCDRNVSQQNIISSLRVHLPNELFMRLWLLWTISPKLSFYSRALKAGL